MIDTTLKRSQVFTPTGAYTSRHINSCLVRKWSHQRAGGAHASLNRHEISRRHARISRRAAYNEAICRGDLCQLERLLVRQREFVRQTMDIVSVVYNLSSKRCVLWLISFAFTGTCLHFFGENGVQRGVQRSHSSLQ